MDFNRCIEVSKAWVEQVIVKYNFCPFARHDVVNQRVRYHVCDLAEENEPEGKNELTAERVERLLNCLQAEFAHLRENPNTETTLVILPTGASDFYTYLDVLAIAEQYLADEGYEGELQIASFHPHYVFAGSDEDDAANYTNRSPYPMLHILREESLAKALANYAEPEAIPERNIEFARRKGAAFFADILRAIAR